MRGVRGSPIFRELSDRQYYLGLFGAIVVEYDLRCFAYCEMTNHAHVVFQTRQANVSAAMRHLNGRYAQWFNETHGFVGHVFERRFHSALIETERHLLVCAAYVVLNPVRARMVLDPSEWRWSSYRAMVGLEDPPGFLDLDWLQTEFGGDRTESLRRYRDFVELTLAGAR
jgi:putative transposase